MGSQDDIYMLRCLQLASNGISDTAPNPMVGCVIVHNDTIIGEGYHQRCGFPHAEVNAINSVKAENESLLPESTLYVNLEPCSHYGKTPPCSQLIITKKIKRVVIGMSDPNEKVNGNGIEQLRKAGIDVTVGVLEQQCRQLNRRFITFQTKKRPYVILKWAQTADGMIDALRTDASTPPI
ncbi:MAG TPA: bifunctional diaminohydroxyphosphoribosylaminopyrimidine deaminase/5-amino-6-(5-phosphoribosylamino)uracil reductase RibD, partial [Paludibacteraceae bacterium]|nr:bifunctional diaminohydroxyphosphoribosylaminopyrimidine deaminase/5-amino-6-(5-phosphoribosylamino)uracil reductase RibD [Paludibacteraceae bacterium]